ncbi:MAG: YabP/YqfC family sporulation protein [Clostridia bacterium]|nr:YabP/YqfC family sporulation protein [Clostridia bacterium]
MKTFNFRPPIIFREIKRIRSDLPQICLCGNREALVEGVLGILEYDSTRIRLRSGRTCVTFSGKELYLRMLNPHAAVVCGIIADVDLSAGPITEAGKRHD